MVSAPQVTFAGELLNVHFDDFGIEAYPMFLRVKALPESTVHFDRETSTYRVSAPARFASMLGVRQPAPQRDWLPFPAWMYEDQQHVTGLALTAKRYACWSDCGWGKTLLMLEFARQVIHRTGGRFLIITMNSIVSQFIREAKTFYGDELPIIRLNSREEMKAFCRGELGECKLAIVNYEKMNHGDDDQVIPEMRLLAGIGLDESSRLKTGGGVQKWAIIKSCKGIEYKLSCTATPAPNNAMEFASQASFLEKLRDGEEILWTYFERDPVSHRWRLRKHAKDQFFEAMAAWSIYIRDPKRYGWRKNAVEVPAPEIKVHRLALSDEQRRAMGVHVTDNSGQRSLFPTNATNAVQRNKLSQLAKGFAYTKSESDGKFRRIHSCKPQFIADGIVAEVREGLQVLVWTVFDAESTILSEQLTAAGVNHSLITGKTKEADRERLTNEFCDGTLPVLVTRASMLGFGRNFQACGSMWFSGWSDSYESYYQAIRRAVRHGQKRSVRVHIPVIEELEGDMLDNIFHKQAAHEAAIREMEANYIRIMQRRAA